MVKRFVWRWLVKTHRWLAIATCLLFVTWFASGIVMMYVGFPELTAAERLSLLPRIDWSAVRISPDRALQIAGLEAFPRELRLEMMAGEPVYRLRPAMGPSISISAVDGRSITHIDADEAVSIARRLVQSANVRYLEALERDQWSVAGTFDSHRPLHKISIGDDAGTELYISSRSGEVMLDTNRRERFWNWPGAVLHWLYFTELRANPPLWRQVVLWTSGIGIYVALSGLWLGIDRLRMRRRYRRGAVTPYRGWMAWHHLAGILGGVFLLTWIFSGWLSMGPPVPWDRDVDAQRVARGMAAYAGNTSTSFAMKVPFADLDGHDARQARFVWLAGSPRIVLTDKGQGSLVIDAESGKAVSLTDQVIFDAARHLVPGASLVSAARLQQEDAYWYSHHGDRKLPVLRVVFDDPDRTWIHIDPDTGLVLGRLRESDRLNRWLFNALHSLDFRWLLAHRPAWDIVVWTLSLAGLTISISGVVIGWRRLRS